MDSAWCFWLFVILAIGIGIYMIVGHQRRKTAQNDRPSGSYGSSPVPSRPSTVHPLTAAAAPVAPTVTAEDLQRADNVLRRFGQAVGTTNDAIRNAATAVARAGGMGAMEDEMRASVEDYRRNPATVGDKAVERTQRPWRWLAAVADEAGRQRQPMLVARICLAAQFWQSVVVEQFSGNSAAVRDLMTIGLFQPVIEQRLTIASAGLTYLRSLPATQLVPPEANEPVPVSGILLGCAVQVEQAIGEGLAVDPAIRAIAQEILGNGSLQASEPQVSEPDLGQPADAIPHLQRRLAEAEQAHSPEHPDTLTAREALGTAYHSIGRIREATGLFEQNLAIRVRHTGVGHPDTVTTINNLALTYLAAGRHSETIAMLTDALSARERTIGDSHPDTITVRSNLAQAYEATNRLTEASALFERVHTDRRRLLGPDHPDTMAATHNLAHAYQTAGRLDEAIAIFEANLESSKRVLGEEHPDTLSSCNGLAMAYDEAGQCDKAIPLLEQNRAARLRVLGPAHVHTITSAMNLASAYLTAGRVTDAIELQQQAVADAQRHLGHDHPTTQIAIANLQFMIGGG